MPTQHPPTSDETHPPDDQIGHDQTREGQRSGRPADDRYRPELEDKPSAYTPDGADGADAAPGGSNGPPSSPRASNR